MSSPVPPGEEAELAALRVLARSARRRRRGAAAVALDASAHRRFGRPRCALRRRRPAPALLARPGAGRDGERRQDHHGAPRRGDATRERRRDAELERRAGRQRLADRRAARACARRTPSSRVRGRADVQPPRRVLRQSADRLHHERLAGPRRPARQPRGLPRGEGAHRGVPVARRLGRRERRRCWRCRAGGRLARAGARAARSASPGTSRAPECVRGAWSPVSTGANSTSARPLPCRRLRAARRACWRQRARCSPAHRRPALPPPSATGTDWRCGASTSAWSVAHRSSATRSPRRPSRPPPDCPCTLPSRSSSSPAATTTWAAARCTPPPRSASNSSAPRQSAATACVHAALFGPAGPRLGDTLTAAGLASVTVHASLAEACRDARAHAAPGRTIVFAPWFATTPAERASVPELLGL